MNIVKMQGDTAVILLNGKVVEKDFNYFSEAQERADELNKEYQDGHKSSELPT